MCLTLKHKDAIENNEMLNDEHIQAAHNLMKKQFPQLGGLQSTLLCQNKGFSSATKSHGALQEGIYVIFYDTAYRKCHV